MSELFMFLHPRGFARRGAIRFGGAPCPPVQDDSISDEHNAAAATQGEIVMLQLITASSYGDFPDVLAEMHRMRYRVFRERLGWDVEFAGGMEVDSFDALRPAYLIQRGADDRINGCVRLLPTTGPTMLRETFPQLLHGNPMPVALPDGFAIQLLDRSRRIDFWRR